MIENGLEVIFWKGQKRYRCPRKWESGAECEYDTHDLTMMAEHMRGPHTRDGKPAQSLPKFISPILDASGNQIIREVKSVEPDTPVSPEFEHHRFKQ